MRRQGQAGKKGSTAQLGLGFSETLAQTRRDTRIGAPFTATLIKSHASEPRAALTDQRAGANTHRPKVARKEAGPPRRARSRRLHTHTTSRGHRRVEVDVVRALLPAWRRSSPHTSRKMPHTRVRGPLSRRRKSDVFALFAVAAERPERSVDMLSFTSIQLLSLLDRALGVNARCVLRGRPHPPRRRRRAPFSSHADDNNNLTKNTVAAAGAAARRLLLGRVPHLPLQGSGVRRRRARASARSSSSSGPVFCVAPPPPPPHSATRTHTHTHTTQHTHTHTTPQNKKQNLP